MIELPLMSFFPSEFETNKQTDSQIRYYCCPIKLDNNKNSVLDC